MKKSLTILELILVLILLSILYSTFLPKTNKTNINELKNKIVLQLKHLRYKSLINSKYNINEELWHKKRWTFKFLRCNKNVGGLYYVMFSDKNKKGHPNKEESIRDPLSNKFIYSSNSCKENIENSSYVLISKKFNIKNVSISCNSTSSLGQISFAYDGKVYSKLGDYKNDFQIQESCKIELVDKYNEKALITVEYKTGFIY